MEQRFSFVAGLVVWMAAIASLNSCGGGGGGGGSSGGGIALLPSPAPSASSVALSGTATYESVPNVSGALVYADTAVKPVRGAYVEVLDANGRQLAVTTTDDGGGYAASVPASTTLVVRIRAQLVRSGPGASWDVTVRDNTQSGAIYSMQSTAFSSGTAALSHDLRAGSGWGGLSYTGERVSAPFAVIDTVYTAMQKVVSVAPAIAFPSLKVFWSVNNTSASGSLALGQIGTTYFVNPNSGAEIYVLGKENVDTDEFDAPVIAHEWGHYYQTSFSRDDSMGGSHAMSESIDRRLAFSEGWGNAWSGIALGRSNYVDSGGPGQAASSNLDLSKGPASNPGWFREASIQSIFWNLNQQVGFKPIHDAMTSALFREGAAVTSIHPFAVAFKAMTPGSASALYGLLAGQKITVDGDPYAASENNDGGMRRHALPMYTQAMAGSATSVCVTNAADPKGEGNKLGSFTYVRFTAPSRRTYQIGVSVPAPARADFALYRGGVVSRNAAPVGLSAGDHVLAISDAGNSGANTCFSVLIQ